MIFAARALPKNALGRISALALALIPFLIILAPRVAAFVTPVFAILGLVLFFTANRRRPIFKKEIFAAPLILITLMSCSYFWAFDPDLTLKYTVKMAPLLLGGALLLATTEMLPSEDSKIFMKYFPLAVMAGGASCVIDLYGDGILYHALHDTRFTLSKVNRSVVSFFLCALIALPLLIQEGAHKQAVLLFALVLAVLYKTDSQAAQVAFALGAAVYFFFPYAHAWAWRILIGTIAAPIIAAPFLAQWMFHHLPAYAGDFGWLTSAYATSRMEIWDFIGRRALESPFYGFGVEATRAMTDFDTAHLYHPDTKVMHPHNFILQLWIEFGLIGAVFAAGSFIFILERLRRWNTPISRLALPVFIAVLVTGAVTYGLWQAWWLGLLGLLLAWTKAAAQGTDLPRP